ncbi:MAG: 23S rRNA (uracil(1939)-C(5))-methyltransferase RlmD, partial [Solirubrobacterales bacterium]|nr:23S rRNA (uracil(1939)-C(5))-methyltransferase RlmD [Solirubrobacterales bacterium]
MTIPAAARPERGAELDLRVDALAFGGNGVARMDGYVVFVRDALPGDRVRAVVTKRKRAYAEARAVEVLEPSPDRIEPLAAHPGAPWQVLPYERQLAVKAEQVDEALRRLGGLDGFVLDPMIAAEQTWRYRNKVELSFGAAPDGGLVAGFHAPGSWEEVVGLDDCLLISERANEAMRRTVAWARAEGLEPFDRRARTGLLRNLVVREGRRTGELQLRLVTGPGDVDLESLAAAAQVEGLFVTQTDAIAETTQGGRTTLVSGAPTLGEELAGMHFAISPEAFFQTNTEMAERLYEVAADLAGLEGWERVFDLFSGIGTVGLVLAGRAGEVWGVEVVERAVADAIANAQLNDVDNAQFFAGDVRLAMRELVERSGRPDVVVVDPPRAGLSQKIVRRIIEAAPK